MTERAPLPPLGEAGRERRLPPAHVMLAVLLGVLAVVSVAAVLDGRPEPLELAQLALVTIILTVVAVQRSATADAMRRRAVRDRTVSRILQGLSRSISPESVVDAVVDELRESSGADHVAVARQAEPDGTLEVTLVPSRGTVPASRTFLRPDILGDPAFATGPSPLRGGGPARGTPPALRFQEAADEVARRVRSGYGLPFTLSAPLVAEGRFVGALILSKRTRDSWSELDRRLLPWAAAEVSAAFSRAYALEAAEARANIDALTGLPNRRYLDEVVAITPHRRRAGDSLGALMIDIDRFKRLNDRYGHATGDAVLRDVAAAIYTTVRAEDTPARYGGEEFAVILRRASALQAADVAERIRAAVAAIPPDRLSIAHPVTVSIGVAVASETDDDVRSLLERADRALYEAKRRGRNRIEVG